MFVPGPLLPGAVSRYGPDRCSVFRGYMLQLRNAYVWKSVTLIESNNEACLLFHKDIISYPAMFLTANITLNNGPEEDRTGSCIFGAFISAVGEPHGQGECLFYP